MNEVDENYTTIEKVNDEQKGVQAVVEEKLHINIPFVEALSQMPKYAKFLKELLSRKRKLEEVSMEKCEISGASELLAYLEAARPMRKQLFESIQMPKEGWMKPSIEDPPSLELKQLLDHLEYPFLMEGSKLLVIASSALLDDQKAKLLEVLRRRRRAIAWKITDIKGISPSFCTHKILIEEDFKTVVQPQRRPNPNMKEVVKKVIKLLNVRIIYPISDSSWASLVQVVPKIRGMTVVVNENNELIPIRTVTGWRIPIAPKDQEKATFTCPYITFAYRGMSFGLCNALATFKRCMMAIFDDLVEDIIKVFIDEFSVHGNSFEECLEHLEKVLIRCEETNLVLS
eukprot:XP_015578336.1 uncharacterized protein LOC107261717 [Ricinus communis]